MALPMLAKNRKMKARSTTRGGRGFTLAELVVLICVAAVLVVVVLPMFIRPPHYHGLNCVNNLKQDYLAAKIWSGDNSDKFPMQISVTNGGAKELAVAGDVAGIFRTMSNELSTPKILVCPEDTKRRCATNFEADLNNQRVSYFVGLDAELEYPQMIFAGDDNLDVNGVRILPGIVNLSTNAAVEWTADERHGRDTEWHIRKPHWRFGNVGFADGSVQQTTVSGLKSALVNTSLATNRWVVP